MLGIWVSVFPWIDVMVREWGEAERIRELRLGGDGGGGTGASVSEGVHDWGTRNSKDIEKIKK
jgi:hypothetical protein